MKKGIIAIGIVALFVGMLSIPAGANPIIEELERNRPGWEYLVIGRIRSYEIVEYNGTEYLECKAVHVRFIVWNVSEKFPTVPLVMTLRFGQKFNIRLEGAEILGPRFLRRNTIIARGTA
jgi:hypothetical protein